MAGGWKSLRVRSPWDLLVTHRTEACLEHSRVTRATRKGFFMNNLGCALYFQVAKLLRPTQNHREENVKPVYPSIHSKRQPGAPSSEQQVKLDENRVGAVKPAQSAQQQALLRL